MLGVHNITDVVGLPVWMIAAIALLVLVLLVFAIARAGSPRNFGLFGQVAAVALLVGFAWLYLDRLGQQDRAEHRRNIEARLSALTAQALLPNSNLACLDAAAADLTQEACEKALYSSAEQVSAALTFIEARLDVLRDVAALPKSEAAAYEKLRAPLVRSMQADHFGLVAQVLQGRDGCTVEKCPAFEILKNSAQIVANMKDRAYETRLTKHASNWSDKPAAAVAASPAPVHPPKESQLNLSFPSASSIPPVSIMANEPGMPGQNGVEAVTKPEAKQPPAKRPPQKAAAQPKQPAPARSSEPPPAAEQANPFPQPVTPAQTTGGPTNPRPQ